jgi:organic hydroperoxide reductase OsmC/OhrA
VLLVGSETFAVIAKTAKETCPISKALGGVGEITLDMALES